MPTSHQAPQARQSSVARQRFSQTLLLATDLQQSVFAELDRSHLNPFAYPPYGYQSGPRQAGTHLGFNGQLRERSTGWYHLGNGHRVYNPVLMRYHSADWLSPFGEGGINPYTYCEGDPRNYTDPTGQFISSVLPIIQRGLTAALHTITPAALVFGPQASGVALQATRFSLAGSVTTLVGATLQLVGYPVGAIVQAAGTAALIAGVAIRGAVAVKTAYANNVLWKTVRDNVKNIVGLRNAAKAAKPPMTPTSVVSESPAQQAVKIRR